MFLYFLNISFKTVGAKCILCMDNDSSKAVISLYSKRPNYIFHGLSSRLKPDCNLFKNILNLKKMH